MSSYYFYCSSEDLDCLRSQLLELKQPELIVAYPLSSDHKLILTLTIFKKKEM